MKNKFLKFTALFLVLTIVANHAVLASAPSISEIETSELEMDFDALEAEFSALSALESKVKSQEISSLSDISDEEAMSLGLTNLSRTGSIASTQGFEFSNFDWISGLWGFLCCPIGFFVVAISKNKSKDEKVSFWIGVAASAVLNTIFGATRL